MTDETRPPRTRVQIDDTPAYHPVPLHAHYGPVPKSVYRTKAAMNRKYDPKHAASPLDRVRVRDFATMLEAGMEDTDAFWRVISDPDIGMFRYRRDREDAKPRPKDNILRNWIGALLARTVVDSVSVARDQALLCLAKLNKDAVETVRETVRGEFDTYDTKKQKLRLDAAEVILGTIGAQPAKQAVSVKQSVETTNNNLTMLTGILDVLEGGTNGKEAAPEDEAGT